MEGLIIDGVRVDADSLKRLAAGELVRFPGQPSRCTMATTISIDGKPYTVHSCQSVMRAYPIEVTKWTG